MGSIEPLRPGDPVSLGGYRLTGRIGAGGQGVVLLGASATGEQVAVKLLHPGISAQARRYFVRELAAGRQVDPFCTARILAADVEGAVPYIVSEFIPGPSLKEMVAERGPHTGSPLDRLAIGTATALTAIHQAGIVHRDFKPANVILGPDGPRVIDFGVARITDGSMTATGGVVGTPAYMAPEQLRGAAPGPAADVFAWGATMVFAATGRPPFGQDSVAAVMHRVINHPPDLGALGGPLRALVAGCLDKDPARRPSARQVLLRLLGHQDAPTVAAPPRVAAGVTPSFTTPTRRWLLAFPVAAVAIAAALAGYFLWPSQSHAVRRPPAGLTWFQGRLGLALKPGWHPVTTPSGTHVLTAACTTPQAGFFADGCTGFWVFGPNQIAHADHGFGSYQSGTMYYPASDVEPCPGFANYYIKTPAGPHIKEQRPVGSRFASYTEWDVSCMDGAFKKIFSGYTESEWYLPQAQVLIVDQWTTEDLPSVLTNAYWR